MRLHRIIVSIVFVISTSVSYAQSDADLVTVADEMYHFGDVKDALEIYKQATELNSSNAYANYMVGKCYLETIDKQKSQPYLLKAYELDRTIVFNIQYLIGSSYQLGYNFDKAIEYYEKYRLKVINERETEAFKTKDEIKKINKRIEECKNGSELIKNPQNVKIDNLGKELNSVFEDYAPVLSADQNLIFFTSRREGSTGGNKDNDNGFFEDIYYSQKVNGEWGVAKNMGPTVNSKLHEACIGVSRDGKRIFIYKDDDKHAGDIFECSMDKNGKWLKPKSIGKEINSEFIENSITISVDEKTIYFSSNRPGGKGGVDIYMSRKEKNGKWGVPVNLGDSINTEYDDEGPYIDGKNLYFSSRGHTGMGGFDLFKSMFDSVEHRWTTPKNLGYPINSTDDDIYFVVSGDEKFGYYASVKENGIGSVDLYKIYLDVKGVEPVANVPDSVLQSPKVNPFELKLKVFSNDNIPLNANVEIFDLSKNAVIYNGKANAGELDYFFKECDEHSCMVSVSMDGYVYKKDKVVLEGNKQAEHLLEKTIFLDKIAIGNRYILRNIYYEYNKATLQTISYPELDKLYEFLKNNPKVKVQIEGHTDNKGSDNYNLTLSQLRVQSVINYLVQKGISSHRFKGVGKGETVPLASNDDEEEGRELNRRTEFVIFDK